MTTAISQNSILFGGKKPKMKQYVDAGTFSKYICDSEEATPLTAPTWRVTQYVYTDATFTELDEVFHGSPAGTLTFGEFVCLATDLATVQALDYA